MCSCGCDGRRRLKQRMNLTDLRSELLAVAVTGSRGARVSESEPDVLDPINRSRIDLIRVLNVSRLSFVVCV